MDDRTAQTKRIVLFINAALLIMALAAQLRILTKGSPGPFDFHCFWYAGNLIWQGTDPYRAFLEKQKVTLPITYLDGLTVREGGIDPFPQQCVPGNTAPVVFLLSPLARFSWDIAHKIWYFLNVIFTIGIGWILPFYRIMSPTAYRSFFNLCTLAALGLSMWILFRLRPVHTNQFPHAI